MQLAKQSESIERPIEIIPGPWNNALKVLHEKMEGNQVVIYLDAPYKREEYSRYYHVLETLVRYNYPSCTGSGLTPKPAERFKSEFFTKVNSRVTEVFINIIGQILKNKWICAWSYSDSGMASISDVIETIHGSFKCEVKSYSAQNTHRSHGGVKYKEVTEYLILFIPDKKV